MHFLLSETNFPTEKSLSTKLTIHSIWNRKCLHIFNYYSTILVLKKCEKCDTYLRKTKTSPLNKQVPSYVLMGLRNETASSTKPVSLTPFGEACLRLDLTAIHEILEKTGYKDDEGIANEVCPSSTYTRGFHLT